MGRQKASVQAALTGIPVPQAMHGRSTIPLLSGHNTDWPDDLFVQISESQVGRALRTHRWKYAVTAPNADPRDDPHSDTYVEQYLYDLQADPYELVNLVGFTSHRTLSDSLRDRLITRMVAAGEPAPRIEPAPPIKSGRPEVNENEMAQ